MKSLAAGSAPIWHQADHAEQIVGGTVRHGATDIRPAATRAARHRPLGHPAGLSGHLRIRRHRSGQSRLRRDAARRWEHIEDRQLGASSKRGRRANHNEGTQPRSWRFRPRPRRFQTTEKIGEFSEQPLFGGPFSRPLFRSLDGNIQRAKQPLPRDARRRGEGLRGCRTHMTLQPLFYKARRVPPGYGCTGSGTSGRKKRTPLSTKGRPQCPKRSYRDLVAAGVNHISQSECVGRIG